MARNRVIYQSEALYVSSGATSTQTGSHAQLERVQSANYNFSISRQDVNQYGQLARIDAISLDPPTVALDFSYYLTDGFNERALGFYVTNTNSTTSGNFPSGHMVTTSGQNFYITTTAEGSDNNGTGTAGTGISSIIGIGNAYLTDYKLDVAIGSLPMVSVTMEASNINSVGTGNTLTSTGNAITGIPLPSVNQTDGTVVGTSGALLYGNTGYSTISALRPGDVTMDITSFDGVTLSDLSPLNSAVHIQSASLNIPLKRTPLRRLGTKFAYARAVDFPIKATLNVKAIVNEVTAQNLATVINNGNLSNTKDVTLTLKGPDGANKMIYILKGALLDSESFTSSIGPNKSVDLVFSTQIGGPNDTLHGVLVSGSNTNTTFTTSA